MATLDSAAAVRRATNQLGRPDGAGMCLANVYAWFGSVPSIGPGQGHYSIAVNGWNYTPDVEKHRTLTPPAGVPVYFGAIANPRWPGDRNMAAGDVGLSIGGGLAIFTDSPTGNTGVMSILARAAQIGRPYLGWTESFLGHRTTAGLAVTSSKPAPVVVKTPKPKPKPAPYIPQESTMSSFIFIRSKKTSKPYVLTDVDVDLVSETVARAYGNAVPHEKGKPLFVEVSSPAAASLIDNVRKRRDRVNLPILKAIDDILAQEDAPGE